MALDQNVSAPTSVSRFQDLLVLADRHEKAIFAGLIILNLVPIWAFHYFPSLDGPAHVSLTYWLVHYDDPALPILRDVFEPNIRAVPNYLIFLVLYPLMLVFPAVVAEKILISLYVVFLPLALRYALRAAEPQATPLAVIGCAITFHVLLLLGFYNTSFALPVFLLGFGFWLRRRDLPTLATLAGYGVFGVLAYLTHLSAIAATCLAILFATLGLVVRDLLAPRGKGLASAGRRLLSHGLWPALGFAPVIALCLGFMLRGGGELAAEGAAGIGLPDLNRVLSLVRLDVLIGHDTHELVVSIGLLVLLYISARTLMRNATERANAGLFVLLGFLLLYLVTPYQFDVRWMPTRLMPYVLFGALLWIAGMMSSLPAAKLVTLRGVVLLAAIAMVVVGNGIRIAKWAEVDSLISEFTSGSELIESNSTLLALRLGREVNGSLPSDRISLFLQMAGYIAVERDVVDLKHFQAQTGAFPLVFREEVDPYRHMADDAAFTTAPLTIDPGLYTERTGQTVDYVLLWGDEDHLPADPAETPLTRRLANDYELIHVSAERGLARLYRLREP